MKNLAEPSGGEEFFSKVALFNRKPPSQIRSLETNIILHVSRILILIHVAGNPKNPPTIVGRTKLAKLDFFLRYPEYLRKSMEILDVDLDKYSEEVLSTTETIESKMIRYRYGPWDQIYYSVFAYMTGKGLIKISTDKNIDNYIITEKGSHLAEDISINEAFKDLSIRARIVYQAFGKWKGGRIKDFIYYHFPEVVCTPYNQYMPRVSTDE